MGGDLPNNIPKPESTNAMKVLSQNALLKQPCLKEQEMSLQCISENAHDKKLCDKYFNNYRACQSFWHEVKKDRRKQGITPLLPPPEERDQIKTEYMKKKQL